MRPTVCLCGRLTSLFGLSALVIVAALADEPLNSWTWRNPLPQGNVLNGIAYANGQFLAVGMAGAIMTSSNGARWEIHMQGITNGLVGATHGLSRYWAVGYGGIILSSPDGIRWTNQVSGTTNHLYNIAFANNRLVAAGVLGTIGVSLDGSAWTWTRVGDSNTLFGLAWGNGVYVAVGRTNTGVSSGGVIFSSPDAVNWTVRSQDQGILPPLFSVAYGAEKFVALGSARAHIVSTNGTAWTNLTDNLSYNAPSDNAALLFNGQQFVAVNQSGITKLSTNGSNWTTAVGSAFMISPHGLAWNNQTYVMVGGSGSGTIATGTNLNEFWYWTTHSSGFIYDVYSLLSDGQRLVGVGSAGKFYASEDGRRWTVSSMGTNVYFNSIAFGQGRYVAVGRDGCIVTSTNGTQWAAAVSDTANRLESVRYINGSFVAVGWPSTVLSSGDGLTWSNRSPTVTYTSFMSVTYAHGLYVITANGGYVYTSPNLSDWTERRVHAINNIGLNDVSAGNGLLVAVGYSGAITTSTNGVDWRVQASPTENTLMRVVYAGGLFVATGAGGTVVTSPDGANWTVRTPLTTGTVRTAAMLAGQWVVAGQNGVVLQSDPLATLNVRAANGIELTVGGQPGLAGRLEYTDALGPNANWQPLTSLSLSNSPSVWMDYPVPNIAGRFYRAVLGQ